VGGSEGGRVGFCVKRGEQDQRVRAREPNPKRKRGGASPSLPLRVTIVSAGRPSPRSANMFLTFPYSDNTATLNVAHVTHVVWGRPMPGATVGVTVFFVGGQSLNLNLTPAPIQQLEAGMA